MQSVGSENIFFLFNKQTNSRRSTLENFISQFNLEKNILSTLSRNSIYKKSNDANHSKINKKYKPTLKIFRRRSQLYVEIEVT